MDPKNKIKGVVRHLRAVRGSDLMELAADVRGVWSHWWTMGRFEPNVDHEDGVYPPTWWQENVTWICYAVHDTAALVPCALFGHDLVDDSHAGPETGDMSVYCKRCGRVWFTTLY